MIKWFLFLLLSFQLSTEARPLLCSSVLKGNSISTVEKINQLNEKYDHIFFKGDDVLEIYKNKPTIIRWYKTRKLKKQIDEIKNASGQTSYELKAAVYTLNRFAFMAAHQDLPLSFKEKAMVSDAQRVLLTEGLREHLQSQTTQQLSQSFLSKIWSGTKTTFHYLFHPILWRWSLAIFKMPHLVNQQMPVELAQKIAWEGLAPHQKEAQKYMPLISTTKGFNQFASIYNHALVISLFTVVPYVAHDQYVEFKAKGEHQAAELLRPTFESAKALNESVQNDTLQNKVYLRTLDMMEKAKGAPLTEAEKQMALEMTLNIQN